MKSAYQNNAVDTVPDLSQLTSDGYPTNGNSSLGIPATQPGAAWFHSVTSEIVNAISALGVTPSSDEVNQLANALSVKFGLCVKRVNSNTPDANGNVNITSVANAINATVADNGVESAGSGYMRFKNGVQICWGEGTSPVTFPKSFTSAPVITLTHYTTKSQVVTFTLDSINQAGFTFIGYNNTTQKPVATTAHYMAIGTWK